MLISVVIPTLNEAACIRQAIASAQGTDVEVIVADGGSGDATVPLAEAAGARVIVAHGGRAAQQNAAVEASRGEALLFLHADTRLPSGWAAEVRAILAKPGVALGALRLAIDGATPGERLVAAGANLRSRWLGLPYGDQGLFLRRAMFRQLGGFRALPIMEDWDLAKRARRHGRVVLAEGAVLTSSRRWRQLGPLRTTLINALVVAGFNLGVPPQRLADFYRGAVRRG